jgi:hypothetical protein
VIAALGRLRMSGAEIAFCLGMALSTVSAVLMRIGLADEGYLAVAPDLYYWGRRLRCLIATVRYGERPLSELAATRDWLADRKAAAARPG